METPIPRRRFLKSASVALATAGLAGNAVADAAVAYANSQDLQPKKPEEENKPQASASINPNSSATESGPSANSRLITPESFFEQTGVRPISYEEYSKLLPPNPSGITSIPTEFLILRDENGNLSMAKKEDLVWNEHTLLMMQEILLSFPQHLYAPSEAGEMKIAVSHTSRFTGSTDEELNNVIEIELPLLRSDRMREARRVTIHEAIHRLDYQRLESGNKSNLQNLGKEPSTLWQRLFLEVLGGSINEAPEKFVSWAAPRKLAEKSLPHDVVWNMDDPGFLNRRLVYAILSSYPKEFIAVIGEQLYLGEDNLRRGLVDSGLFSDYQINRLSEFARYEIFRGEIPVKV